MKLKDLLNGLYILIGVCCFIFAVTIVAGLARNLYIWITGVNY